MEAVWERREAHKSHAEYHPANFRLRPGSLTRLENRRILLVLWHRRESQRVGRTAGGGGGGSGTSKFTSEKQDCEGAASSCSWHAPRRAVEADRALLPLLPCGKCSSTWRTQQIG
eukprot:CAMPEP_0206429560 /NCGR_PEP_ID=MMETSP0324_2-20121206/6312_1 /ASSEMBLY_ACC=CAM_ASM_000836 /TAXON_ID=2866 /ORGANISM="Crypthecodinium cohnii, Strain Seligo" /LENGTH=114 /DNA_ID=CAMNT_0053895261 /DNA_START=113 /DNA_END=457 /DNA_ORIENTATION=+